MSKPLCDFDIELGVLVSSALAANRGAANIELLAIGGCQNDDQKERICRIVQECVEPIATDCDALSRRAALMATADSENMQIKVGRHDRCAISWLTDVEVDEPERRLQRIAPARPRSTDGWLPLLIATTEFSGQEMDFALDSRWPAICDAQATERWVKWSAHIGAPGLIVLAEFATETGPIQSLLSAAQAGLFVRPGCCAVHVGNSAARFLLCHLDRRQYRVRLAVNSDVPELVKLETKCWPRGLRASRKTIQQRLAAFPQGQLVLEHERNVVAAAYSQRIEYSDSLIGKRAQQVHRLHNGAGSVMQILALNVLPEVQDRGLGDQLLEFALQYGSMLEGVRQIVGVTRCKNYRKYSPVPIQQYIRMRDDDGRLTDPVLRMHERHGAAIDCAIEGYRPKDFDNDGYGVLVKYDAQVRRQLTEACIEQKSSIAGGASIVPIASIVAFLTESIRDMLGVDASLISISQPLMEMGLDSAGLLMLLEKLGTRFRVALESSFFFEHSSIDAAATHLCAVLAHALEAKSAETSSAAKPRRPVGAGPSTDRDIAIVGIACKLPGGIRTPEGLWDVLIAERDVVGSKSPGRWSWPSDIDVGTTHRGLERGGFLDAIDEFDAGFFRISPREAELMDPQQRILMELSWTCLEHAGYAASALAGKRVGVFVGASGSDYQLLQNERSCHVEAQYGLATSMAIVANRVSYFFDFIGPSVLVDTACSSSLVALSQAVQALRAGECEQALVGGVHVMCHPASSIAYYRAGMLSDDGRCKVFDEAANGYVRSEGGIVLLLKPLTIAQRAGDIVHAVLKGVAVNHGGQASGLTVPHPGRQAELISAAYADAQVDPATVSYVEAHGTGTALGDPVEVDGIKRAFSYLNRLDVPCGIGSVKSNLGHLEAAAGLAGLLKVVLCMRHSRLPATLHFRALNPHINLQDTGLYITAKGSAWDAEASTPLRAGISSFGSGGTNAHVIVEKYHLAQDEVVDAGDIASDHPALIVLSAKNEERLKEYTKQLLAHVSENSPSDAYLAHLAYTLQIGREAMEQRLAFTATTIKELQEKLTGYLEGKAESGEIEACYRGEVKKNKEALSSFNTDEDTASLITTWLEKGKYSKLLELWVKGLLFDWTKLYDGSSVYAKIKPRRVSLPTYPFARERYWIETSLSSQASQLSTAEHGVLSVLHPLLQLNTSDLTEQRFSSTLSGEEFFLTDHVVSDHKVLPGVAYLEMARVAVARSAGLDEGTRTGMTIQNVVWLRPVEVRESKEVHIGLCERENGEIEFEIYTTRQDAAGEEEVVHAQGRAVLMETRSAEAVEPINLPLLRSQCDAVIDVAQCYAAFSAMGLEYGPAHRGLTGVQVGTDTEGDRFVLAHVTLPLCVSETRDLYVLHPSVLDSAQQAAIGFSFANGAQPSEGVIQAALPFALETLQILGRSPTVARVLVRARKTSGTMPIANSIQKLDIDIGDESGRVCVRMRGFTLRAIETEFYQSHGVIREDGMALFTPHWEATPLLADALAIPVAYGERWVFLDAMYKESLPELKTQHPALKWAVLPSERATAEQLIVAGEQVFSQVQSMLQKNPRHSLLLQVLLGTEIEQQEVTSAEVTSALSGLLKSAGQENPKFGGQVITLPRTATVAELSRAVDENASAAAKSDAEIRYVDGVREVTRLKKLSEPVTVTSSQPWKDGGVYLITGGAGGLGLIFAREIANRVKAARIILTGRSDLSAVRQAQLDVVNHDVKGTRIEYRVLDLSNADAVTRCVRSLVDHYGALNGIVHSAGVIHDNFIIKKTTEEFRSVLVPKVTGTMNLDQATKAIELDCFIVFSSVAGVLGNVGQSDYALANAFMDRYATHRNRLVEKNQRHGKTLSINWPLWADGGMNVDEATKTAMRRQGLDVLATDEGVDALYRAWRSDASQVVVLAGERRALETLTQVETKTPTPREAINEKVIIDSSALRERTQQRLRRLFSDTTKLGIQRIDPDEPLKSYGIDSIMIVQLNQKLSELFGKLSKTLLYEYPTLSQVSEYLVSECEEDCLRWSGLLSKAPQFAFKHGETIGEISRRAKRRTRYPSRRLSAPVARERIAIIGMSGRYPHANTLHEYWENLKNGKDCIGEIPGERWSLTGFFEANVEKALEEGKSYSKWGGFVEGFADFDPFFFNISPREAANMDPQERLFLQECWKVFEDAGCIPSQFDTATKDRVGVYGAITKPGVNASFAALVNRVSHVLDLRGPSVAVDTMCSSSLVALHRACEDLHNGSIDMALVGAVNLYLTPRAYLDLSRTQLLSTTREPFLFRKGGKGFVPSEGVGAVLLKRLSVAEKNRDNVLATILGSAVNHSGRTNGYMVPNPNQQASAIEQAILNAGLDPSLVGYVEMAANGSEMSDAIEMRALTKVFQSTHRNSGSFHVGSLKAVLGHGEAVSGMAQLMKVVLQLRHRMLCPAVSPDILDAPIGSGELPFEIPTRLMDWRSETINGHHSPRRAGITNLGAGGVNAHLIVEEYPPNGDVRLSLNGLQRPVIFVLSAKSKVSLAAYLSVWREYVNKAECIDLIRLCYTLQTGRESMKHRFACVISDVSELTQAIEAALSAKLLSTSYVNAVDQGEGGPVFCGDFKQAQLRSNESHQESLKIAQAWTQGYQVAWSELYADRHLSPLSGLPTYPFINRTYWRIPQNESRGIESADDQIEAHISNHEHRFVDVASNHDNADSMRELLPRRFAAHQAISDCDRAVDCQLASEKIRNVVKRILAYAEDEDIDDADSFFEMGFSSITIVEFAAALGAAFGFSIPETIAFDYPNIAALARHLAARRDGEPTVDSNPTNMNEAVVAVADEDDVVDDLHADIRSILSQMVEGRLTVEEAESLIG